MTTASAAVPEFAGLDALEAAARARLDPATWGYFVGGAEDEVTLRENRAAFARLRMRPRVLVDVSRRELATTVLGCSISVPVLIAPTALQRMAHPDGELATARAAAGVGTIMVVSTLATTSLEAVRAAATGPQWFQLYVLRDREATRALVERADAAGYDAIVLTADTPMLGRRERDIRHRFRPPPDLPLANLIDARGATVGVDPHGSGIAAHAALVIDPSLSWRDVEWLRSITRLPVVLKGIVRADDAARAVEHGAAGIIVSNHGGRQLDTTVPTISALPDVVRAVDGRIEVLLDGGVRRGTDVLKAIALGARAVLVGRPAVWGLALAGEAGVRAVLEHLRDELDVAMALAGCASLSDVTADLLAES